MYECEVLCWGVSWEHGRDRMVGFVILPPSQNDSPQSQKNLSQNDCPITWTILSQNDCHVSMWFLKWYVPSSKKTFNTGLDIRGSNSNIFKNQSHHQEDFRHRNFQGCSGVVGVFYFEHHTYNYLDNGEWALISPKFKWGQSFWDGGSIDLGIDYSYFISATR